MKYRSSRLPGVVGIAMILASAGALLLGVPSVRADELEIARAQHREITERIAAQEATLAQLDEAQAEVDGKLKRTAGALRRINTDLTEVRTDVARTRAALAAAEARYASLVAELKHLDWTLAILEEEIEQGETDLDERRRMLGRRLGASYRAQQTTLLQQVLNADSLAAALSTGASYARLGEEDARLAREIEADQRTIDALRRSTDVLRYRTDLVREEVGLRAAALDRQRSRLEASEQRLAALERRTKKLQRRQLAAFRRLADTRRETQALLRDQEAAQARLKAEIERIVYKQLHDGRIPSRYNGFFRWPLLGDVSQEFGCTGLSFEPALGDCPHFHKGIDVVSRDGPGTPIRSAAHGAVVFVGFNPYDKGPKAWIVIVAHSPQLLTWYAHGQPRAPEDVYPGATVKAGQVIGFEGNTGRSTGTHLHWGVQLNGEFVNPRLFL